MHANHRLNVCLWVIQISLVVTVYPNPMHLSSPFNLFLPDNRDVILRLTRYHAGIASRALVEVNRHAPGIAIVLVLGV